MQQSPSLSPPVPLALGVGRAFAQGPESMIGSAEAANREWDDFAALQPGDTVVQTTAWAAAKRRLGYDAKHVVWREGGAIVGGAHIIIRRFKPYGAVGYVARGPLLRDGGPASIARGIDAIEQAARQAGVTFLIIQPAEGGEAVEAALDARGYHDGAPEVAPTATIRLDLRHSTDQLLASMSKSVRKNISRSLRKGQATTRFLDAKEIGIFHQLHAGTGNRQGFKPMSLNYLRAHWEALAPDGRMRVALTEIGGEPVAGEWVTSFGDRAVFRLCGWNGRAAEHYPNEATHWWILCWARDNGFRYGDFGGLNRAGALALAAGAASAISSLNSRDAFKSRFGGQVVILPRPRLKALNPIARPALQAALFAMRNSRIVGRLASRLRAT